MGENVAGGGGHREAAFQVTRPQPCFRSREGGLTQDSVQWVSHVNGVELGGRQGAAHGPVSCGDKWRQH